MLLGQRRCPRPQKGGGRLAGVVTGRLINGPTAGLDAAPRLPREGRSIAGVAGTTPVVRPHPARDAPRIEDAGGGGPVNASTPMAPARCPLRAAEARGSAAIHAAAARQRRLDLRLREARDPGHGDRAPRLTTIRLGRAPAAALVGGGELRARAAARGRRGAHLAPLLRRRRGRGCARASPARAAARVAIGSATTTGASSTTRTPARSPELPRRAPRAPASAPGRARRALGALAQLVDPLVDLGWCGRRLGDHLIVRFVSAARRGTPPSCRSAASRRARGALDCRSAASRSPTTSRASAAARRRPSSAEAPATRARAAGREAGLVVAAVGARDVAQ